MSLRRSQVWSVALRDMADFRRSRYAFYSLLVPPLAFGAVLPFVLLVPLQAVLVTAPNALDLDGLTPAPANASFIVIDHVEIAGGLVEGSKISNASIANATLRNVFVQGSLLSNVTLVDSFVVRSNIKGPLNATNSTLIGVAYLDGESPDAAIVAAALTNMILLLLLIIPAMVPTVLASYSLVGEKANGSLEPLLATPSTDAEILAGKVTGILLPTLIVAWVGVVLAVAVVGALGGELARRHPLPLDVVVLAGVLFVPGFGLLSILASVIVSSRVSDVRAAQQIGGFVVLPVVFLMLGQVTGLAVLGPATIVGAALVVAATDLAVAVLCLRLFDREKILTRWK